MSKTVDVYSLQTFAAGYSLVNAMPKSSSDTYPTQTSAAVELAAAAAAAAEPCRRQSYFPYSSPKTAAADPKKAAVAVVEV